ncbi:hypothetical protein RJT34_11329 [Clitoria ternatea]|uniref:Uncharacterized protein n=1 Tax=Clitoria ternatea TaxID=43366 RepID=A0AAN9PIC8_CLITE
MAFVKFLQNSQPGSVLVGAISYGKLSLADQGENKNPEKHPASYRISKLDFDFSNFAVWLVVLMVLFNGVSSTEVVLDNSTIPASVNIGLLYSFNTSVGRIVKVAVEAAVEDVNSDPSILGKTN